MDSFNELHFAKRQKRDFGMKKLRNILNRVFDLPGALRAERDLRRKKRACILGDGVCLHPFSRIENCQEEPSAIMIAAHSYIVGNLQVPGHGGSIRIGEHCYIGEGSRISSADSISIGHRVLIAHNVNIHDHNAHSLSAQARHRHMSEVFSHGHPKHLEDVSSAPIIIEDDAWIGFNSTILKGVTIGRGAVVGAASVVTKDVPSYAVVVGNPARIIDYARP